jgi:hypothetical protein
MTWIIDANVLAVANGRHEGAGLDCERACVDALTMARDVGIFVDEEGEIFAQYDRQASRRGQPGVGDYFWRWLWDNQAVAAACQKIAAECIDREYVDFPDDPALAKFDRSDRVFVAVAIASGLDPEILNASDTDWWIFREALEAHGLRLVFLCPELMGATLSQPSGKGRRRRRLK